MIQTATTAFVEPATREEGWERVEACIRELSHLLIPAERRAVLKEDAGVDEMLHHREYDEALSILSAIVDADHGVRAGDTNIHLGSSFDSFLDEHGIREDVDSAAQARIAAMGAPK